MSSENRALKPATEKHGRLSVAVLRAQFHFGDHVQFSIEHEITQPSSIYQSCQELNVHLLLDNAEGN